MGAHVPSRGLVIYRDLLRISYTPRLTLTGVLAQYSSPMVGMGVLLAVKTQYHSFTLAGAASAASALCFAISGRLLVGSLIDMVKNE